MRKIYTLTVVGILVLAVGFVVLNNENTGEFDYCQDQPLFGLQYQNCDSIECINFYEDVKENIKTEHCGVSN